ncbi:U2 small nuclear ribonucleo auxiliary factor [Babesia ovata]|uniref:U2 small nuclear ribonucleo auxiliary factor n=1 Tax=Babesia ovata TaxID=189622 RepID=A0A2H6KH53_9APIC|nr:U2 small nuclear ribonucleo auxiliary factor [Babesia ovata]GBE62311.1 U2 small nuclear ribonucleo auxiliary factor [Babesia ovata]
MRSRSRSHSRHRYRRHRSSRDRSHSRSVRSSRYDRDSRHDYRGRDRSRHGYSDRPYERGRYDDGPRRKNFRYDSPPKGAPRMKRYDAPAALSTGAFGQGVGSIAVDPLATKPYREIYIGNIPPNADVNNLLEFLNEALTAVNGTSIPGNACQKGWISADSHYAFVEMRTMEEASNCIQLSGINYLNYSIRINRPKTYNADVLTQAPSPTIPTLDPSLLALGIEGLKCASEQIAAAADMLATERAKTMTDRLCVENVTDEPALKSDIEAMGKLKFYQYVTEENKQPLCLFEYENIELQKIALEGLKERGIEVVMAVDALERGALSEEFIRSQISQCDIMKAQIPTRVLLLANLVSKEELEDDEEYYDIIDDVRCECEEYGRVVRVELPRVPKGYTLDEIRSMDFSAVGCAFVLFADVDGASKARKVLDGRKFGHRIVECHFFSELLFQVGEFSNPKPNFSKEHSSIYNPIIAEDPNQAGDILNELRKEGKA